VPVDRVLKMRLSEVLQWRRSSEDDAGVCWLREDRILEAAQSLPGIQNAASYGNAACAAGAAEPPAASRRVRLNSTTSIATRNTAA